PCSPTTTSVRRGWPCSSASASTTTRTPSSSSVCWSTRPPARSGRSTGSSPSRRLRRGSSRASATTRSSSRSPARCGASSTSSASSTSCASACSSGSARSGSVSRCRPRCDRASPNALSKWGAPIWPPNPPNRSSRPGEAVAPLDSDRLLKPRALADEREDSEPRQHHEREADPRAAIAARRRHAPAEDGRAERHAERGDGPPGSGSPPPRREQGLHGVQIVLRVHADGRLGRLHDRDRDAVLEEAQLLEPLGLLELRRRQAMEGLERGAPVGVETDVLVDRRADAVAV